MTVSIVFPDSKCTLYTKSIPLGVISYFSLFIFRISKSNALNFVFEWVLKNYIAKFKVIHTFVCRIMHIYQVNDV